MDEQERLRRQDLVVDRIRRVEESGSFAPALEEGALAEAALLREDADEDLDSRFILGWLHLYRYGGRPGDQAELDQAVEMFLPCMFGDIELADFPEEILPRLIDEAVDTVTARAREVAESHDPAEQDELIALWERIITIVPADDPESPGYLSNLANAVFSRFQVTGETSDLNLAIEHYRTALASELSPSVRAALLSNLASALDERFDWSGDSADLEEAVRLSREAVEIVPRENRHRPTYMANLGSVLGGLFERRHDATTVDEAVLWLRRAMKLAPQDELQRVRCLSNIGLLLGLRYAEFGHAADLDAAETALREGLALAPNHPDRGSMLTSLGGLLIQHFQASRRPAHLDEAVSAYQEAVAYVPDTHPERTRYLGALGGTLAMRAELAGPTAAAADDREAVARFRDATNRLSASPAMRLDVAEYAGTLLGARVPTEAAGFLELAVRLLPQAAASRELERPDQLYGLGRVPGLAADAAALVLRDPQRSGARRREDALQLLEAGRAVLFAQALETRDDLTGLREDHPAAAESFTELRDLLDQPLQPDERRELVERWEALLAQIRSLPGQSAFAKPPALADLIAETVSGPIATLNVSPFGSDALLLTRDGITHIPLPGLDYDGVIAHVDTFLDALRLTAEAPDREARRAAQREIAGTLGWLWDNATGPVLAALGYDRPQPPGTPVDDWPRVWWAPGGLLGMFPLHASGRHDGSGEAVLDRVISSFTPTIGALRYARRRPLTNLPGTALIVAMPTTPGVSGKLTFVPAEAAIVARSLPGSVAPPAPTAAEVLDLLPHHAVAHFACHGVSDPADPSHSRLLLHDHATRPLTVASLASVRLDRAQLAYLSACETARSADAALADESIHLASAFQLAGYPHVVGTLWPVDDRTATRTADLFYAAYARLGPPHAAAALHEAVRTLRTDLRPAPSLWAAHLHAGA
ncbi:CHAT domain-containing protein [Streptomyces sp. NPDC101776]|uniref:CHAT domain-containing tetratricopeptide repeat protein n=1 Tax=Streptomyces sp. NPDC101776 TaxID=3366146 RepID=UPI00381996A7